MNGQLLTVVSGYLSLVGLLALLAAVGVPCAPAARAGLVVAELLLVVQALLDGVSLLRVTVPTSWPPTWAISLHLSCCCRSCWVVVPVPPAVARLRRELRGLSLSLPAWRQL